MISKLYWASVLTFLGLVIAALVLAGCYAAQSQQEQPVAVDTAKLGCKIALENESLLQLAAAQAGLPLEQYLEQVCAALPVVAPLLRVSRARAACVQPIGIAGSSSQ